MRPDPGTYALIMALTGSRCLRVGRLGSLMLRPGWYVYVGSAFGPGGVRARVAHHRRLAAQPRWHVDYLRRQAALKHVWYTCDPTPREHEWARVLRQLPGAETSLRGFGSSDCGCPSHLVHFSRQPSLSVFRREIRSLFPEHALVSSIATARKGCHATL